MQLELERIQSYFDQALRHMTDGAAIFDADGVLKFADDQYRSHFLQPHICGYLARALPTFFTRRL